MGMAETLTGLDVTESVLLGENYPSLSTLATV